MSPRLADSLEALRKRLLDLSRRNRLVHLGANRTTAIHTVGELPSAIWGILAVDGHKMRFRPGSPQAPLLLEDEGPRGAGVSDDDVVPQATHLDDILQTELSPERLAASLRRLHDNTRLAKQETGVHTLFVILGSIEFLPRTPPGAEDPKDNHAPLILLPVTLERKGVSGQFSLQRVDEEVLVNPALIQILKQDGVVLPSFPAEASAADVARWLSSVSRLETPYVKWQYRQSVILTQLSFSKLVIWKDLERSAATLVERETVRRILGDPSAEIAGLPAPLGRELDTVMAPETSLQVLDADSSQLEAMVAGAGGRDIIVQGPPGTGKSQTIANLIAHLVAEGKRVCFVAEKMAALQVVQERLTKAGIGALCLEMHAMKEGKAGLYLRLGQALDDLFGPQPQAEGAPPQALGALRARLWKYIDAVHRPRAPLGVSVYEAFGKVAVGGAPSAIDWTLPPEPELTPARLTELLECLGEVAIAGGALGMPIQVHPWRHSTRTVFSAADQRAVLEQTRTVADVLSRLRRQDEVLCATMGLPASHDFAEATSRLDAAKVLADSPGIEERHLLDGAWDSIPADAAGLIADVAELGRRRASLREVITEDGIGAEVSELLAVLQEGLDRKWRFLNWLRPAWRDARSRALALFRAGGPRTAQSIVDRLLELKSFQALRRRVAAAQETGEFRFGRFWAGEGSSPEALQQYADAVVKTREALGELGWSGEALALAVQARPTLAGLLGFERLLGEGRGAVDLLEKQVGAAGRLSREGFVELDSTLSRALSLGPGGLADWASFSLALEGLRTTIAPSLEGTLRDGTLSSSAATDAFLQTFWEQWVDRQLGMEPILRDFQGAQHDDAIRRFRELDRGILALNAKRVIARVRARALTLLADTANAPQLMALRREAAKKRKHAPFRDTVASAFELMSTIVPCWMMSPTAVAQFTNAERDHFDAVIFDEASQLPTEEAVGAMGRADWCVIVGDSNQLPPTNFFAVQIGQISGESADEPVLQDGESVLEDAARVGIPSCSLRWHYRSRHESLIAFSNHHFYDNRLFTFPSADRDREARGVRFVHCPGAVYEGAGRNRDEARIVAQAVILHARQHPTQTLGVATLSVAQRDLILDELEVLRREHRDLEPFFAEREDGTEFFVKNLETVQGDDRDVIMLSVAYGRDPEGRISHNFGPVNQQNGWRRLNVLVTRARDRLFVFSSIRGVDLDPARLGTSRGARALRDYLNFAEEGVLSAPTPDFERGAESPFEAAVRVALHKHGIECDPQVGVAGYRVDLGVKDPQMPGRYVCGIECDGATYHSGVTARDRDRLRQEILEGLGWKIIRIWSTDWFKRREQEVLRVVGLVERHTQAAAAARTLRGIS